MSQAAGAAKAQGERPGMLESWPAGGRLGWSAGLPETPCIFPNYSHPGQQDPTYSAPRHTAGRKCSQHPSLSPAESQGPHSGGRWRPTVPGPTPTTLKEARAVSPPAWSPGPTHRTQRAKAPATLSLSRTRKLPSRPARASSSSAAARLRSRWYQAGAGLPKAVLHDPESLTWNSFKTLVSLELLASPSLYRT